MGKSYFKGGIRLPELLSKSNMCISAKAGMMLGLEAIIGAQINGSSGERVGKELQTWGQTDHFSIYCSGDNTVLAFHPRTAEGFIILPNKGSELLRK